MIGPAPWLDPKFPSIEAAARRYEAEAARLRAIGQRFPSAWQIRVYGGVFRKEAKFLEGCAKRLRRIGVPEFGRADSLRWQRGGGGGGYPAHGRDPSN